jgi:1,2-dihydroxy-3-keto-5-methylthiopentene dioxygenase
MSALTVYSEQAEVLQHSVEFADIAAKLAQLDVQFERWQANARFASDAEPQTVLAAYQADIERLNQRFGFQSVDVISVKPDHPNKDTLRQKFLAEHTHSDFEVRFFVEGKGLFFLHVAGQVFAVLCEQGDLISVPANTPHWFDMGSAPDFKCIRLFTTEDGWIAEFTGNEIALSFPSLAEYCAQ